MKPTGFSPLVYLYLTLLVGFGLTALQWIFARLDNMDTVARMQSKGISRGLPFTKHFGACWGDILIVTPLFAYLVARYWTIWSEVSVIVFMAMGLLVSFILHVALYKDTKFPEAHMYNGKITASGWTHMVYMGLFLAAAFLFYFGTPHQVIPPWLAIAVSVALAVHIFFGVHIPLGLVNPKWYGRTPDAAAWITFLGTCGLLGWRTCVILAVL